MGDELFERKLDYEYKKRQAIESFHEPVNQKMEIFEQTKKVDSK